MKVRKESYVKPTFEIVEGDHLFVVVTSGPVKGPDEGEIV